MEYINQQASFSQERHLNSQASLSHVESGLAKNNEKDYDKIAARLFPSGALF